MSLKDLTWEHHKNAERQEFVKIMMSGNIHPKFYATFLYNLHPRYDLLEAMGRVHGLFDDIPNVQRHQQIIADFNHLWKEKEPPPTLPSTNEYIAHMKGCMNDPEKLMAHIYTFHMGDLSGGQMIARKVPGLKSMFHFEGDIDKIKTAIREKLNDDMADEARYAFNSATQLFKEMMDLDCEHYLEQTDNMSE
jgi:heme oxygenase